MQGCSSVFHSRKLKFRRWVNFRWGKPNFTLHRWKLSVILTGDISPKIYALYKDGPWNLQLSSQFQGLYKSMVLIQWRQWSILNPPCPSDSSRKPFEKLTQSWKGEDNDLSNSTCFFGSCKDSDDRLIKAAGALPLLLSRSIIFSLCFLVSALISLRFWNISLNASLMAFSKLVPSLGLICVCFLVLSLFMTM